MRLEVVIDSYVIFAGIAGYGIYKVFPSVYKSINKFINKKKTQSSDMQSFEDIDVPDMVSLARDEQRILENALLMEQQIYDEQMMDAIEKQFFGGDADMSVEEETYNEQDLDEIEVAK